MNITEKIKLINNHFKNTNLLLELSLLNYETYNFYIRLDYFKKINSYKFSWFDLEVIKDKKIEKYISSEYVSKDVIDYMFNILFKQEVDFYENVQNEENKVILNVYVNNGYHFMFNRYIPKELSFLNDVFSSIFDNLPRKIDNFLYELQAELMGTKSKYNYTDVFLFDLFNDPLDLIFDKKMIELGEISYKEDSICYLEIVDDKYYAIVNGTQKNLVVINYSDKTKKLLVYCSCPCEFYCKHFYHVVKAIRENKMKKFYKVIYINNNLNLLENAMNKYFLCTGVEDYFLEVINKYGELELVPILDDNNNLNFKIIEDDEDNNLSKKMDKIIKSLIFNKNILQKDNNML